MEMNTRDTINSGGQRATEKENEKGNWNRKKRKRIAASK